MVESVPVLVDISTQRLTQSRSRKILLISRCTCYSPIICTCEDSDSISDEMLEDMVSSLTNIIKNQDKIIISGTSVKEASDIRTKFGSSVTVTVTNFSKTLLSAVRTSTMAGEIEVPQCDVAPLGREALLCKRITKPSSKDGCAGTANYKINGTNEHLHIMWSSPNNFDKHASHLAVGVTEERSDKFNDMYYQKPSWFARKYVYHDTQGIWYSCPDLIIHAKSTTRPTADVEVYIFPQNLSELDKLEKLVSN